jgi:hypothetical protein
MLEPPASLSLFPPFSLLHSTRPHRANQDLILALLGDLMMMVVVVVMGAGLTNLTRRGATMQSVGGVVRLGDAGVIGWGGELLGDALGEGGGWGRARHGHGGAGAVD